jgi:hypothetical protein
MMRLLMFALVVGPGAQGAEPAVKPIGVYPFPLPGVSANREAKPRLLVWCHGARLLGVVVPDERHAKEGVVAAAPAALRVRDGRCEADGNRVSFGFLMQLKAWVFEPSARTPREERPAWLLHRFEGSVQDGVLRGVLVQVDVSHPGYAFRESKFEVNDAHEAQESFADETGWQTSMARAFSLVRSEP